MRVFKVLPMVPMVYQYRSRANGTIDITIDTNGITNGTIGRTNGTIGRTLNDIGIPLVPLVEPWTHAMIHNVT